MWTIRACFWLQMFVTGLYLNFSFCASSNAALRDLSSWSASSSLIFSTASWPSLAERASVRSSTCERSSLNILSVWYCSEFHLSARKRVWFSSKGEKTIYLTDRKMMDRNAWLCLPGVLPSCKSFALWMTEAISPLREATSLRNSWFSRRRLDNTWLCGSSAEAGGRREGSCLTVSWGTTWPESELSFMSAAAVKNQNTIFRKNRP